MGIPSIAARLNSVSIKPIPIKADEEVRDVPFLIINTIWCFYYSRKFTTTHHSLFSTHHSSIDQTLCPVPKALLLNN